VIEQNEIANLMPCDFIVVNPADWADMELTKDTYGRYIVGDPANSLLPPTLWGRAVVVSNGITAGTFLAGVRQECCIYDRQDAMVEISTEYSDYFVRNMVAIRCEERLALVVYRPLAFVQGTFNSSPA
jgi:HK97 family phage major capsid protein